MRLVHIFRSTTAFACVLLVGMASAKTYVFKPDPENLDNLDHYKFYSWGISWVKPQGEIITEAKLVIKNIYDWTVEEGDVLYTTLLDSPATGFKTFFDDQGGGDAWAGQGPKVGEFTDPYGGQARGHDLVYTFSNLGLVDDLEQMVTNDNKFGFGFDPDCHYFNDGAYLKVTTEVVPEPATMVALGTGIAALWRRRARNRASR